MSNQIKVFENRELGSVRTVMIAGEPWFVLKDVCDILGINEPHRVAARLDDDERTQSTVIDSLGRKQEMTVISESGLYNVILRSDKPEAKPFRKWVTSEVLPSIRRTGKYAVEREDNKEMSLDYIFDGDVESMGIKTLRHCVKMLQGFYAVAMERLAESEKSYSKVLEELAESKKENAELNRRIGRLYCSGAMDPIFGFISDICDENHSLSEQIAGSAHKVEFYDNICDSKHLYSIDEAAQLCCNSTFVIGRNRLYDWLIDNGYINSRSKMPCQKWIERGFFAVRDSESSDDTEIETFVTPLGLQMIFGELKNR